MTYIPVSVLMCVREPNMHHLQSAISSLITQTCDDFELIFVNDDGHTKNEQYYLNFVKKFRNHQYIHHAQNLGLTESLNDALGSADGTWIMRLDHDDMWLPQKIEMQLRYVRENPDVDLVYTSWYWRDETKKVVKNEYRPVQEMNITRLKQENIINGMTVMYRRDFARKIGGYSPEMLRCQDWDLWLKMVTNQARVATIGNPTVIYRWTGKNMTAKYPKQGEKYVQKIREKYRDV